MAPRQMMAQTSELTVGMTHLPARRVRRAVLEPSTPSLDIAAAGESHSRGALSSAGPRGHLWDSPRTRIFALLVGLGLVEAGLFWQPELRTWVWLATLITVGVAALLWIIAGQKTGELQFTAYAAAGGCLSLLLGFITLITREYDLAVQSAPVSRNEAGLQGAVVFFLAVALSLVRGESVWLKRAKLGLDVAILAIVPLVAAMPISEGWDLRPEEERTWSSALLFAASYGAVCYAVLVVTRRTILVKAGSAIGLLALGVVLLSLAAGLQAGRSVIPLLGVFPVGQSVWVLSATMLAVAGWYASRGFQTTNEAEDAGAPGEDSRLRLVPAALAGIVVGAVAVQQVSTRDSPSSALFLGSTSLFWLIVSRLLVTLAENRRLVRTMHTVDRGQLALRDLGAALNSSLETERVWQHVCAAGQDLLQADSTTLWLVDRPNHDLVAVEVAGARRQELLKRRFSLDDRTSLAVRVARTRTPEVVRNAAEARRSSPKLTVMRGSQCLLAVPLRRGRHAHGVLVFSHSRDASAFRQEDVARAELLASQAVVAVRNAELHGEVTRGLAEMSATYDYARHCEHAVSSEEIARELLLTLLDKIPFDLGTVLLADNGILVSARGIQLRRRASDEEPTWDVAPARVSPVAGRAYRSREAFRVDNDDRDFRAQLPESVSQLAVPLFLREHAVGVVELESSRPDVFTASAQRLVAALARHAALAIDNLRLEEDTREVENLKKLDRLKTELLGNLSHELRTPLHAIKGYATTLLQHERMKADMRREFLSVIDSESDRLQELINNLLDMSRLEAGVLKVDPAPAKLGRMVQTAVQRASHQSADHSIVVEWPQDPWVMADVPRILQVVTNLLSNAIKYSPDGGDVRVWNGLRDGMLFIAVQDSGIGIPPRELSKIFDRFHRVEGDLARRVSGTGLGLAICRGLVEAHGGRIWVESEPEVGSTFGFTLPICDPGES